MLDAAAALIAEVGWGRVTIRAVAERAGLPHGTVSYHFPGKQALLSEAALELVERSFPLEELRAADDLADVVSQMRAWANGPSPVDQTGRAVLWEAIREAGRDPLVRTRVTGLLATYRRVLADLIAAAQRRGRAPAGVDPAALATLLAAAADGLLLQAALDPGTDLAGAVEALEALLRPAGCTGDRQATDARDGR